MKTLITAAAALIAMNVAWPTSALAADACETIEKAVAASLNAERRLVRTVMLDKGKTVAVPDGMIVPEGIYQKAGDRWIKNPGSLLGRATIAKMAGTTTYSDCKSLGEETLDGVRTAVYSARGTTTGGVVGNAESDAKLWVAKSDGLPRKIVSSRNNKDQVVTQIYSYGPEIQAPAGDSQATSPGLGDALRDMFKK
jgi:hypothetical protein